MAKKSKIARFNLRSWRKGVAEEHAQGRLSKAAYAVASEIAAHADEFSGVVFGAKERRKRRGVERPALHDRFCMGRTRLYEGKKELAQRGWLIELAFEVTGGTGHGLVAMMRGEQPVDVLEALARCAGWGDDVDAVSSPWTPTDVKDAQDTLRRSSASRPLFFDPVHRQNLDDLDRTPDAAIRPPDKPIRNPDESIRKPDPPLIYDQSHSDSSLGKGDAREREDASKLKRQAPPAPPKNQPLDLCPASKRLAVELARTVKETFGEELLEAETMVAYAVKSLPRGVKDADGFFAVKLARHAPGRRTVLEAWRKFWRGDLDKGWKWGEIKRVLGVSGDLVFAPGAKAAPILEYEEKTHEDPDEELVCEFERALWMMDPYRGEWSPERVRCILGHAAEGIFSETEARRQRIALSDALEALELAPELLEAAQAFVGGKA